MLRRCLWGIACGLLLAVTPGARAGDKFFDSGGVKIRYTVQGKGEPVLLIHGFGANVGMQWAVPGVIKALAKDYRVIAFDNRGHGKSGKPHDPAKYGAEMAEDAVRLLDHLKIKKAHVVGYSMGALITAKVLVTHPERLRSAVLGGAGAVREGDEEMAAFVNKLADALEQGKGIAPLVEALTPAGKPKPSADQIKLIGKMFLAMNDAKALAAVARSFKGLAVTDAQLKAVRVPVLGIVGADDPLKKGLDALRGLLPGLKVVVIPDADHITAFNRPEFSRALQSFLKAHRTSGKSKSRGAAPAGSSR